MPLCGKFSYTNGDGPIDVPSVHLNPASADYALREDEPDRVVLSNTTTAIDQPELLTYQYGEISKIPTLIRNANPPKLTSGVQYGVRLDEVLRVTSPENPAYVVDIPIVANITIKHSRDAQVTPAIIDEIFARLQGACYKQSGETRFRDLMRSALRPFDN